MGNFNTKQICEILQKNCDETYCYYNDYKIKKDCLNEPKKCEDIFKKVNFNNLWIKNEPLHSRFDSKSIIHQNKIINYFLDDLHKNQKKKINNKEACVSFHLDTFKKDTKNNIQTLDNRVKTNLDYIKTDNRFDKFLINGYTRYKNIYCKNINKNPIETRVATGNRLINNTLISFPKTEPKNFNKREFLATECSNKCKKPECNMFIIDYKNRSCELRKENNCDGHIGLNKHTDIFLKN